MIDLLDLKISGEVGLKSRRGSRFPTSWNVPLTLKANLSEPLEPSRGVTPANQDRTSSGQAIDVIGRSNFQFHTARLVFLHDRVETVPTSQRGEWRGSPWARDTPWKPRFEHPTSPSSQTTDHLRKVFPSNWTHIDRRLCASASPTCSFAL